ITVEETNTFGLELDFTEGMAFDKGYLSPYMVTDQERMEAATNGPQCGSVAGLPPLASYPATARAR
ncbi:hypothetical protein ACWF09_30730, partial [Streptomyces sp. NPDC055186]